MLSDVFVFIIFAQRRRMSEISSVCMPKKNDFSNKNKQQNHKTLKKKMKYEKNIKEKKMKLLKRVQTLRRTYSWIG